MASANEEPYWRLEHWIDALGQSQAQWVPSEEMTYLLGCLMSTKDDVEMATMMRPTLILLPAGRVPSEAQGGGTLMGIPFEVSATVAKPSLVYPARTMPGIKLADLSGTQDKSE